MVIFSYFLCLLLVLFLTAWQVVYLCPEMDMCLVLAVIWFALHCSCGHCQHTTDFKYLQSWAAAALHFIGGLGRQELFLAFEFYPLAQQAMMTYTLEETSRKPCSVPSDSFLCLFPMK